MPNRILKESITTSDTIDALSAEEERFFCRLLVVADDFGRADARAAVLRAKCFPLKVDLQLEAVEAWLAAICRAGLARTYHVDGRRYLEIVTWREHQNVRAKASKFPDPAAFDDEQPAPADDPPTFVDDVIASASKCDQASAACDHPQANVPVLVLGSRSSDLESSAAVASGTGRPPDANDRPTTGKADLFPEAAANDPPRPVKPSRKPPAAGIGGDCTRWLERFRELSAEPGETPDEVLARSADTKELRVRYANARKVPGRTAEVLLTALERGLEGAWWGAKTPLAMLSEQAITAGLAPPRNEFGARPAVKEPSGRLPDFVPPVREPAAPLTEAERQEAAEARAKVARMAGGLAARAGLPSAPAATPDAVNARRAVLREQAREAS